jgi:hypothetical protein
MATRLFLSRRRHARRLAALGATLFVHVLIVLGWRHARPLPPQLPDLPTTNVEMIEMHGKIRLTSCPEHEEPPKPQEWHTANE